MKVVEIKSLSELSAIVKNEVKHIGKSDIIISKDNCSYCDKLKNHINSEAVADVDKEVYFVNLSDPEFGNWKSMLISTGKVNFVPTLVRHTMDLMNGLSFIVDDELYEVVFDGRVSR